MDNTFVLGLGAQKCGTTWLNNYLKQYSTFDTGFAKEYHIWDALDVPILSRYRQKHSLLNSGKKNKRARMQNETAYYFEYFNSLLQGDVKITADITPAYSGLSADRLSFIKNNFEEKRIVCKAVLFIRDPIERCRSAVQYNLGRNNYNEGLTRGNSVFCSALNEYYRTLHADIRTNYKTIIENIKEVFEPQNYYIGVYESMFEKENVSAISNFLNIQPKFEFANTRVNSTASGPRPSCDLIEENIREHFKEVYEYCATEIPETVELWAPK